MVWDLDETHKEDLKHIGIIYDVVFGTNDISNIKTGADDHDSLGARWYDINELKEEDLSPLAKVVLE